MKTFLRISGALLLSACAACAAPRNVEADTVSNPGGESEKFLFYRGVGCGQPILNIIRNEKDGTLRAMQRYGFESPPPFWLADIRPDGTAAFQYVAPMTSSHPFEEGDYSAANITGLRASLEGELIRAGLYKDEAQALLNTWQVSYFKNSGLRAFYIWPRDRVDRMLPLTISPEAAVTRVMVGRIELVTPEQRAVMARIATADPDEAGALFMGLGRFRDALLLDEEHRRPTPGLERFIKAEQVVFCKP